MIHLTVTVIHSTWYQNKVTKLTLYWEASRANSWAAPRSGTPARTLNPCRRSVWAMRIPAWPVAPATNTVPGSLRLWFPKFKPDDGLVTTGTKDLTSGSFPKSKLKKLELGAWESSTDLGKGASFLAKTVTSLWFLRVTSLGWGVVVRRKEFEVRVGAIRGLEINY